jgi:4-amino-4-deoxy-L-arabinose transferase-like glycosyltransferase
MDPVRIKDNSKPWRWLWLIFFGALILRLAPLLQHGTQWTMLNVDARDYVALAQGLRAGCGFARETADGCASGEVLRLPGYPVLLASMRSVRAAIAATSLLAALVCMLVGLFASEVWGNAAGILSALLLCTDIPSITINAQPMSDSLFQSLVTLGFLTEVWMLELTAARRKASAIVGSVFLALATLVRPMGILLPLIGMLPFLLLLRAGWVKRIVMAIIAAAVIATPIVAWAFRNQVESGVFTYSTDGPVSLYYYGAGGVVRSRSHQTFESVIADFEHQMGVSDYIRTPAAKQSELIHRALTTIREDPKAFASLVILSFVRVTVAPEQAALAVWFAEPINNPGQEPWFAGIANRMATLITSPAVGVLTAVQFAMLAFIWIGVGKAVARWLGASESFASRTVIILAVVTLALLGIASFPGGTGARYRTAVIPFMVMLAGYGWCAVAISG